jgi:geranylgeranylglycerol-phosphate geranylgeranyltransferase
MTGKVFSFSTAKQSLIMYRRFFALLQLTRPLNGGITFISVLVATVLVRGNWVLSRVLLACLSAAFVAGAGNALNDYYDLEIDRINKPSRPLPSGRAKPMEAVVLAIILFAIALGLSFWLGIPEFIIVSSAIVLLWAYAAVLKQEVLIGNIIVSFLSGLAFVFGGLVVHARATCLVPALFAFLFHLGREIIKDAEDMKADAALGARTLPIRIGLRPALICAAVPFGVLAALSPFPFTFGLYRWPYFLVVFFGVDLVLLALMIWILIAPSPRNLRTASAVLKADMLIGLLSIFLGR